MSGAPLACCQWGPWPRQEEGLGRATAGVWGSLLEWILFLGSRALEGHGQRRRRGMLPDSTTLQGAAAFSFRYSTVLWWQRMPLNQHITLPSLLPTF